MKRYTLWFLGMVIALLIMGMGCNVTTQEALHNPVETQISQSETHLIADTNQQASFWEPVAKGVDVRSMRVDEDYTNRPFNITVVRLDPEHIRFETHYTPTDWYTFDVWRERLENPLLIVNASFFTPQGYAVGLVFADGVQHGQTLRGYGGMFQVSGDDVRVRSLVQEPYNAETYDHAVQGFPMLVEPNGVQASTGRGFDVPSRRTMIAQDRDGNILVMVTPLGQLTLRNAQRWLLASGLNIDVAFGLDGGKSSGLYLPKRNDAIYFPSFDPVPVVLAVYAQ